MEQVDTKPKGTRRLVLGFDAGCMTCSGLARSIEEAVGDKLELRSLSDPLMERWRRQALGEHAPWVPTLIEVVGANAKAWTGARMGTRLSWVLGPVATWRVLRIVGDPRREERTGGLDRSSNEGSLVGLTRGHFLRGGLAGAMAGASLLFGTDRFVPGAAAAENGLSGDLMRSTGTLAQQERAKAIVRSSGPYEKLVTSQVERLGISSRDGDSSFDLDQAIVNVEGQYAGLVTVSVSRTRSVAAAFIVDLSEGSTGSLITMEATPVDGGRAVRLVTQENFRDLKRFGRVVIAQDHMIAGGRKMSFGEARDELARLRAHQTLDAREIQSRRRRSCANYVYAIASALFGGSLCRAACILVGAVSASIGGVPCWLACSIISTTGAYQAKKCICENKRKYCPCDRCT